MLSYFYLVESNILWPVDKFKNTISGVAAEAIKLNLFKKNKLQPENLIPVLYTIHLRSHSY